MKWFKFYGQDFLTDPKMRVLTIHEAMCWITLMALANAEDKDGKISNITESEVMLQSKVEFDSPYWFETFGFIKRFEELKMLSVIKTTVTNRNTTLSSKGVISNETIRYDILLTNFNKRQKKNLSNAERQKKFRETHKNEAKYNNIASNKNVTEKDVTESYDSNARIDKNRIDKNRIDKNIKKESNKEKIEKSIEYLRNFPQDDKTILLKELEISESQLTTEVEKALNWLKANGQRKQNYKAYLKNWLLKNYKRRIPRVDMTPPVVEMTAEEKERSNSRLQEIKKDLKILSNKVGWS